MELNVGENASFYCLSPYENVRWFYHPINQLIPDQEIIWSKSNFNNNRKVLFLRHVSLEASGYYSCYGRKGRYDFFSTFLAKILLKVYGK